MATGPLARHLLAARDLVDRRYAEALDLEALARAASVSPRHFSRSFRRVFGETPHQYLLTRRLERAATYGVDAAVRDPSGNLIRIVQPIQFDIEAVQRAAAAG